MDHRFLLALVAASQVGSCVPGPGKPAPALPQPEMVTGIERLGWSETVKDAAEFSALRFVAYVDGTRTDLRDASCDFGAPGSASECNSSLPPMAPGIHTIELAAYFEGPGGQESARSSPIQVQMTGAGTAGSAEAGEGTVERANAREAPPTTAVTATAVGIRMRIEAVASGLVDPTDLAFGPDGRIFVGERGGRIRLIRDGVLLPAPALPVDALTMAGEGGLLALAVDPAFDRNRFVYAIHTAPAGSAGVVFRLIRFRDAFDTLVDPVVLLDGIPASGVHAAASLRFGPDAKLYVALDDGGDARFAADLASYSGKILRLNADGSTPRDQAAATPVYSSGYRSPRGLAWHPRTGALFVADGAGRDAQRLIAVAVVEDRPMRTRAVAAFTLPPGIRASGITFYRGRLFPGLEGDLLVAAGSGPILRIRFDPQDPLRIAGIERLAELHDGSARAVAAGPDEALYVLTDGALERLVPDIGR